MLDHIFGLILLGLGIQSPMTPAVKGDSTEQEQMISPTISETSGSHDSTETTRSGSREINVPLTGSEVGIRRKAGDRNEIELMGSHARTFTLRTDLHDDLEEARDEASGSMKLKLDKFKTALRIIKDQKKQETVSRLQTNLTEVNTKRTDKMSEQLGKMTDILARIASMGATLKSQGKDTGSLDAAVTAAGTAVKTAQDAVVVQAGKTYVVTISSENNLKTDVGTVMKSLQTDLKNVYELVVAARKSISNAIRILAQLRGETVPEAVVK